MIDNFMNISSHSVSWYLLKWLSYNCKIPLFPLFPYCVCICTESLWQWMFLHSRVSNGVLRSFGKFSLVFFFPFQIHIILFYCTVSKGIQIYIGFIADWQPYRWYTLILFPNVLWKFSSWFFFQWKYKSILVKMDQSIYCPMCGPYLWSIDILVCLPSTLVF